MRGAQAIERVLRWVRRTLAVVFGVPIAIGIGMSLVDSYRRRGKKPKPFPTTPPTTAEVGEGTITTYTFGKDLYADMLAAIEGAQRQILFETYIWKGDAVGEQFKAALAAAADRGVEVYCIYDGFANLVVSPRFKRFPPSMKVLRYPVYGAGWRFFDLRRYGRDHRKILVVDDKEAYVGGYNIGSAYETEWRDTHVRITGPGVQDLRRAFADFWNLHRRRRLRASERPLLVETASVWEPHIRLQRNVPRLWMFPIRGMYLEAINRASTNVWMTHAYFIPDQDFVGRAQGGGAAAASTSGSWCRSSPTTSSRTGSPAGTSPSCSRPASGSSGSRTRWCTRRPRPWTAPGRPSARRTSTGSASRATTRSTSRSSTTGWPRTSRRSGRSTSRTASS